MAIKLNINFYTFYFNKQMCNVNHLYKRKLIQKVIHWNFKYNYIFMVM